MTIQTAHIQDMLKTSYTLARSVEGASVHGTSVARAAVDDPLRQLERAANLARHAAAELEDEFLRARDGWPT